MDDVENIAKRLAVVRRRLAGACVRSGRAEDAVCLIGVTKKFGLPEIRAALSSGLTDFGENRPQELAEKAADMPGMHAGGEIKWHMVGHLQRNKVGLIVEHADVFHALDSGRLALALDKQLELAGRTLDCFVQVNVSGEESKQGVEPASLQHFADEIAHIERIRLVGLMTLASPTDDPETVRPQFSLLRSLAETHSAMFHGNSPLLSMGMSGDFEIAVEEGATHVRLGTAIFGERPSP